MSDRQNEIYRRMGPGIMLEPEDHLKVSLRANRQVVHRVKIVGVLSELALAV